MRCKPSGLDNVLNLFHLFAYCSYQEVTNGVEIERALETQRVKLLRLLAGWISVVAFVTAGPFVGELPRWFRSFLESVLMRAEYAAQNLVFVSACLSAKTGLQGALEGPASLQPDDRCEVNEAETAVPSTEALLRRMKALLTLLQDLPRHGMRSARSVSKREPARTARHGISEDREQTSETSALLIWRVAMPRVERPPDKFAL